jgi:hypothetical protein
MVNKFFDLETLLKTLETAIREFRLFYPLILWQSVEIYRP